MADPQEKVYIEFDNYAWDSFTEFQEGLSEILEGHLQQLRESDPTADRIPAPQKQQLIDQAKLFFFCSHTGNILNLEDYYAWKRNNGGKITYVEESVSEPEKPASESSEVPYSNNYQHVVDLIVSGKPVPGIKEIPDTILPEQSSKAEAPIRRKPWETNKEELSASGLLENAEK